MGTDGRRMTASKRNFLSAVWQKAKPQDFSVGFYFFAIHKKIFSKKFSLLQKRQSETALSFFTFNKYIYTLTFRIFDRLHTCAHVQLCFFTLYRKFYPLHRQDRELCNSFRLIFHPAQHSIRERRDVLL